MLCLSKTMDRTLLLIPFGYFAKTRLHSWQSLFFHGYAEWLPSVLILHLIGGYTLAESSLLFLQAYICFISFYEIGYFVNDYYYTQKEIKPRSRLSAFRITHSFVAAFFLIRVATFLGFGIWLFFDNSTFWYFYLLLGTVFSLHNMLPKAELKVVTFVGLAFFRFFAPFGFFVAKASVANLLSAVLLGYVLLRTLGYMDSKDLLNMPQRKQASFKVLFYLLLLPLAVAICLLQESYLTLWANIYFALPWIVIAVIPTLPTRVDAP